VKEEEVNPPCLKDLESIFERENTTREERKEGNPEDLLVSADPDLGPSTVCGGVWRCQDAELWRLCQRRRPPHEVE